MKILIKNVDIVTMNEQNQFYERSNIVIEDNIITHIGDIGDIDKNKVDYEIEGLNKLAMPGLINCHTHLGMSLFRNYADDMILSEWLTKKIWPAETKLIPEDIYWASLLSMSEMIASGTTTFCDMYFFMDQVIKALDISGMRASLARGIVEEDSNSIYKIEENEKLFNEYNDSLNGRIKIMFGPHAPYTCSSEFLLKIMDSASKLNASLHIHLSETKKEVEESFRKYNKSPIKHMYDLGLFDLHTVAAHCVHIDEEDIKLIKEKNVHPVNNPSSNFKLASGFSPVNKMLKEGIKVALGTDGAASNNNLNMFKEMSMASIVNKAVDNDPMSVTALEALNMATINGAYALGLEKEIGSLEIGKKADIIILDMDKPHLCPRNNIYSTLAYSVYGSDVDTVIVDGNILMERKEFKTIDIEKVKYMVKENSMDLLNNR
jgi:5-methylthioadenosine/S-adenosylhomocysteine deaminase